MRKQPSPALTFEGSPTLANALDKHAMKSQWDWRNVHLTLLLSVVLMSSLSMWFLDKRLVAFFQQSPHSHRQVWEFITQAGVSTAYIVTSLILFVFFQWIHKRELWANKALLVFLSVTLGGLFNAVLKFLFGRYRPKALLEEGLYGFTFFKTEYIHTSFPSGHANTAAALVVALCLIFPRYRLIFLSLALLVIMSRVALCIHFLSDVIWGAYVGGVTALWVSSQMDRRGFVHRGSS